MMDCLEKPPIANHLGIFHQATVAWKDFVLSSTQGAPWGIQVYNKLLQSFCSCVLSISQDCPLRVEWKKVSNWRCKALGPR